MHAPSSRHAPETVAAGESRDGAAGILRTAVAEAVALLHADGGLVYTLDDDGATLRLQEDVGITSDPARVWIRGLELPAGGGMFWRAVAERRAAVTGDYAADATFAHTPAADRVVAEAGIVSMVAAPLLAGEEILGALGVYAGRADAFSEADAALVRALAGHAATSLANRALIDELERSREQLERRSERERSLRELVGSLAAIHDTDVLLQRVVDAAATVAGARGAFLDRIESDGRTHTAISGTVVSDAAKEMVRRSPAPSYGGVMGRAVAERRIVVTGDYLDDGSFVHMDDSDDLARQLGTTSVVAVPLIVEDQIVGVLAAYSDRRHAFDDEAIALIAAFADHAAVAIANARRTDALARSRELVARRASAERGLREMASRLAAIRNPEQILEQAVAGVCPIVGAEWAEIARVEPDGRIVWTHMFGIDDPDLRAAQHALDLHVGEGMLGLAATSRRPVATGDYLTDASFLHVPTSDDFARRAGFRSLAAAPLISDDEVVGILAVHSTRPDAFDADDVALVGAFADVAAAAMGNARLIEALDRSESRYRSLLAASPDIVFVVDADGNFTFLSETLERQLDWPVAEMLGRHFSALIDVGSMGDALKRWADLRDAPGRVISARFLLRHRDGRRIPFEIRSAGIAVDGAFTGVQGAARDVSERERLERELRDSEERYRYLVKASPDVVWAVDGEGRFTFLSDRLEQLTGYRPEEMIGRHFLDLTDPAYVEPSMATFYAVQADPSGVYKLSILMPARDAGTVPVDIWVTGRERDGAFAGAHGSIRDMRERERLEGELRESEARYRYLVDNSPDIVWSAGADGLITYLSETSERLLGWRPEEIVGRHFSVLIHPESLPYVQSQYATSLAVDSPRDLRYRFVGLHRDGSRVPLEMHARTIVEDGEYRGTHGAVRDLRDRERLEDDLRRQAADLAASEERAHLARELHDSVTQALFSMTLVTRSIELQMEADPVAARGKLQTLRDLQQDALAEMRALIFELRPASLETEGLARALRTHASAVQGRTGLAVVLDAGQGERLPAEVEAALFRVAQEALNNVVKHAAAHAVRIALGSDGRAAWLSVEDDGIGFDPSRVPGGHLGLAGMRARAEKLGGRVHVASSPGEGTRIRVEVPLGAGALD